VIKALDKYQINSELVSDCLQTLMEQAKYNRVSAHRGIEGNEIADQLVKKDPNIHFTGPESACGISERAAKWAIKDDEQKTPGTLESTPRQKHAKGFLQEPSAIRTRELFKIK
jgi:hypothetical protein